MTPAGPGDPTPPRGARTGPARPSPAEGSPQGARTGPARPSPAELADGSPHGALYLTRLLRSQLALSLVALVAFGGVVLALPLAVYLLPGLQDVTLLGVPLPVLVVLWPPFPLLVAIGWLYSRRARALEAAFAELVADDA